MLHKLTTRIVEKPWGRTDIPAHFGDFAGWRIGEIWFEDVGTAHPLMVKFLFTSERLSVQVHPDDGAARAAGFPCGKEECWLVLDAADDAELGVGLNAPHSKDALHAAALSGEIVDMVDWRRAVAGDFVYNQSGTIHAIGAGLTVVEVQQNVDCTWRLYDYGRPRPLHLDEGLAVAHLAPRPDPRDRHVDAAQSAMLVDGPFFHLCHLSGDALPPLPPDGAADYLLTPLSRGCSYDGEGLLLGECARITAPSAIRLTPGARALLCWPALR
ncbi:MAG: class I mannose-6-phosphate isomerase [Sphingomonadaceae bacterium]|nr:class I mannose-6-phosphate isomerase [Sphingomonadaceae bacterium]